MFYKVDIPKLALANICYPFDLFYSKCRFSTDKIKQGDLMFNVYYLQKGVTFTEVKTGLNIKPLVLYLAIRLSS